MTVWDWSGAAAAIGATSAPRIRAAALAATTRRSDGMWRTVLLPGRVRRTSWCVMGRAGCSFYYAISTERPTEVIATIWRRMVHHVTWNESHYAAQGGTEGIAVMPAPSAGQRRGGWEFRPAGGYPGRRATAIVPRARITRPSPPRPYSGSTGIQERRWGDSNSRGVLSPTFLAGRRTRPLCDISRCRTGLTSLPQGMGRSQAHRRAWLTAHG